MGGANQGFINRKAELQRRKKALEVEQREVKQLQDDIAELGVGSVQDCSTGKLSGSYTNCPTLEDTPDVFDGFRDKREPALRQCLHCGDSYTETCKNCGQCNGCCECAVLDTSCSVDRSVEPAGAKPADLEELSIAEIRRRLVAAEAIALTAESRADLAEHRAAEIEKQNAALYELQIESLKQQLAEKTIEVDKLNEQHFGDIERNIEFALTPDLPQDKVRGVARLLDEKDEATTTREIVKCALNQSQSIDGRGMVQLVVGGGEHRAWTFDFPLNYAFRYLDVLARVWIRNCEDRYLKLTTPPATTSTNNKLEEE